MKRIALLIIVFVTIAGIKTKAQENNTKDLELIQTKQKLFEKELELMKKEIQEAEIAEDSLKRLQKKVTNLESKLLNGKAFASSYNTDSIVVKPYGKTWEFNFFRLFEGSIELSYEKMIDHKNALDVSLFGTYADENGIGQRYVDDYYYEEYDAQNNHYIYYQADKMLGGGLELKWKRYLLAGKKINRNSGWKGLYLAPSLMYRGIVYEGTTENYYQEEMYSKNKKFSNTLHIGKLGFYAGNKFVAADIFVIDMFIGGALRLSQYTDGDLNDYSNWVDMDYTGILPTAGIKFGVVNP